MAVVAYGELVPRCAARRAAVAQPAPVEAAALARGRADRARDHGRRETSSPPASSASSRHSTPGRSRPVRRSRWLPTRPLSTPTSVRSSSARRYSPTRWSRRPAGRLATVPQIGEPTYAAKLGTRRPRARPGGAAWRPSTRGFARSPPTTGARLAVGGRQSSRSGASRLALEAPPVEPGTAHGRRSPSAARLRRRCARARRAAAGRSSPHGRRSHGRGASAASFPSRSRP